MMMSRGDLKAVIRAAISDARIELEDLSEDGTHYAVSVASKHFRQLTQFAQHRVVATALGNYLGRDLCAITLQTSAIDD